MHNVPSFKQHFQESLQFDLPGQRVMDGKKKIADIEIDEMSGATKQEVMQYFADEDLSNHDPVISFLKQLKLPRTFMYVWIQFIRIVPGQRGQGKGSEILNTLALQYPKGTLLALSAEEVSSGKTASSLRMLQKFYTDNGFKMIRSQGKTFGFRLT
jgi:GNAT superfamily N-acetyltransferase